METTASDTAIEKKIGQLIVIGFHGRSPAEASVRKVMGQVEAGDIGGVILFRYNIEDPGQLKRLTDSLTHLSPPFPLFTFVDQEGGRVQRLNKKNGFRDFFSAKYVAQTLSPEQACRHYREMGALLADFGFNFDFAPCIDLDGDPPCDVIGRLDRCYSHLPGTVVQYARAMINALHDNGIFCCLKHYPGHGRARGDSHMGLVDISDSWGKIELEPYAILIKESRIDAVMTAHINHNGFHKDTPATFSPKWIDILRKDMGFNGLIIPDDLHMGAILQHYTLEDSVIRTLNAGLDILLFSNNPLAAKPRGIQQDSIAHPPGAALVPDADLPAKIIHAVKNALSDGRLSMETIDAAFNRVTALKRQLKRRP